MSRNLSKSELSALAEKVLTGKASPAEKETLNEWYKDFNDHEVLIASEDDKEQIRKRLLSNIGKELNADNLKRSGVWKIAVTITLILTSALTIFLFYYNQSADVAVVENHLSTPVTKHTGFGQKRSVRLPDGSLVKLNAGSSIQYDSLFKDDIRKVTLVGEAFFDVKRDESRSFVIHTSGLRVEVLGTSFNIRSYQEEQHIDVAVKTGRVMVSKLASSDVLDLRPNEMAVFDNLSADLMKHGIETPETVFGWVAGKLVLQDESLDAVIAKISRWYDVSVQIGNPRIKDKKITANMTDPTLKEVMESLSHTYKFEYEINGDVVTIE